MQNERDPLKPIAVKISAEFGTGHVTSIETFVGPAAWRDIRAILDEVEPPSVKELKARLRYFESALCNATAPALVQLEQNIVGRAIDPKRVTDLVNERVKFISALCMAHNRILLDRSAMAEAHRDPKTGEHPADDRIGREALAEYDEVLALLMEAINGFGGPKC